MHAVVFGCLSVLCARAGHLLDAEKLQEALKASLGDVTFHEAYERTGRIINITIPGSGAHNGPRFLNYLTAPNILLWSAASASCALAGGLSEEIVAKDMKGNIFVYSLNAASSRGPAAAGDKPAREAAAERRAYQPWEDCSGQGVHADMPMNRLKELFNVNFFIVSQNTACAIPFVQRCTHHVRRDSSAPSRVSLSLLRRITSTLGYLLRSEVLHRCEQAISLGLAPKMLKQVLNQKYVGDVTIAPGPLEVCGKLVFKSGKNAQRELVRMGERSTWPSISQVRGQCEQEMVLDQCVRHLASQVSCLPARTHVFRGIPLRLCLPCRQHLVGRTGMERQRMPHDKASNAAWRRKGQRAPMCAHRTRCACTTVRVFGNAAASCAGSTAVL